MDLDESKRVAIADVGTTVLEALQEVASGARSLVDAEPPTDVTGVLAVNTNLYVHGPTQTVKQHIAGTANARASFLALSREPFVARVTVTWEGGTTETYHFARPCSFETGAVRVLRYLAPLGRLAEAEAG